MANPRGAKLIGGKRLYQWGPTGERFWSVTTILNAVPKPALVNWAAKMAAEFAVENVDQITALVRKGEPEAAVALVKGAPWRSRDRAAAVGTHVHELVSAMILGTPWDDWPEELSPYLENFLSFVSDYDVTFEASECQIYSRAEKYAGSFDFIATIPRIAEAGYAGPKVIGDVKTGKGVYAEAALQMAAYAAADFIGLPNDTEVPMPQVDAGVVLHLRPDGYALIPVRVDREVFQSFLYTREMFRWLEELSGDVLGVPLDKEAAA
jgi:hypothetical protein